MPRAVNPRAVLALLICGAATLGLAQAPMQWSQAAPITLSVFIASAVAWTLMRWPDTPVALAAALVLVALGVASPAVLYASLGNSLVWLLIGAFLMAAVLQQSGLVERWTLRAVAGAGSASGLLWRLSAVILATAFIVPSTSGRAALLLPVFLALARSVGDRRIVRALALLFPSVILLSACASLLGAGAHLLAVDFMQRVGAPALGYGTWMLWGLPFAVLSCIAATALIERLFLDRDTRQRPLHLPAAPDEPLTPNQKGAAAIAALTLAAWASTGWHGVDASLIAVFGSVAMTCRPLTGVDMKAALKKVEWNLVLFLAATLVMGEALSESGAARALADALLLALPPGTLTPAVGVSLAATVALLSHLLIPSRTARAVVLLPTVALPLAAAGLNPVMLIFLCVLGSGFCQTLIVSAKPLAVFARVDLPDGLDDPARPIDGQLARLSLALLPVMLLLLGLMAFHVWPLLGLPLLAPARPA